VHGKFPAHSHPFFFIKDQVDGKRLQIVYCPTGQMLADFFTKPLQGRLFHLFRAVIMGWAHIYTLKLAPSSMPKEHVGDMSISDDAAKSRLTYAQAVKGLKKSVVKKSFLSRTKDKHFSAMGATTTRSIVRFSTPIPRARE
jgi:hypothetical protein